MFVFEARDSLRTALEYYHRFRLSNLLTVEFAFSYWADETDKKSRRVLKFVVVGSNKYIYVLVIR